MSDDRYSSSYIRVGESASALAVTPLGNAPQFSLTRRPPMVFSVPAAAPDHVRHLSLLESLQHAVRSLKKDEQFSYIFDIEPIARSWQRHCQTLGYTGYVSVSGRARGSVVRCLVMQTGYCHGTVMVLSGSGRGFLDASFLEPTTLRSGHSVFGRQRAWKLRIWL